MIRGLCNIINIQLSSWRYKYLHSRTLMPPMRVWLYFCLDQSDGAPVNPEIILMVKIRGWNHLELLF